MSRFSRTDYAISSVPIEDVRVKFDNSIEEPYIKFRWRPYYEIKGRSMQSLIDCYVIYVQIVCREEDWTVDVQLPLQKKTNG